MTRNRSYQPGRRDSPGTELTDITSPVKVGPIGKQPAMRLVYLLTSSFQMKPGDRHVSLIL